MERRVREAWWRVVVLVVLQVLGDVVLARGGVMLAKPQVPHKNFSEDTSEETTSTAAAMQDTAVEAKEGGAVRCHCNMPGCVPRGYMCKSVAGACFSQPSSLAPHTTPLHGCLELLPQARHLDCANRAGVALPKLGMEAAHNAALVAEGHEDIETLASSPQPSPQPSLLSSTMEPGLTCCSQDMCNYRDMDVFIRVEESYSQRGDAGVQGEVVETVWFRAATIAVPIAGLFILVVLVVLASRMLAKETKRQRMAQVISERYMKAPLYSSGCSEALQQPSLYYHPPLIKAGPLGHLNRGPYDDKPPGFRSPVGHACSLEEIKPLNVAMTPDSGMWEQRDSPIPP